MPSIFSQKAINSGRGGTESDSPLITCLTRFWIGGLEDEDGSFGIWVGGLEDEEGSSGGMWVGGDGCLDLTWRDSRSLKS